MNWAESLWFFDVDDTLIETAGPSEKAADGVAEALAKTLGKKDAKAVRDRYHDLFLILMAHHAADLRPDDKLARARMVLDYEALMKRIHGRQPGIVRAWGRARKWSREILVALAAEDAGVDLTSEQILAGADGYWTKLAALAKPVPGAPELFRVLRQKKRPIFLVTSSDSRVGIDANGDFVYDPAASEAYKRRRLADLPKLGLAHDGLAIGDPEDKPGEEFFLKGLRMAENALGGTVDRTSCVIVGDSFAHDLMTPLEKMGFGFGVLYARGKTEELRASERLMITGRMDALLDLAGA